jgi:SAM-dependent methyltransferase
MILEVFQKVSSNRRRLRKELFQRAVQVSPHWRILDIGCGENYRSPWFERSANVVGIDIRQVGVSMKPYEKFVCGDACKLPFPDNSFDLVYSNSLIEHLPTREHQRQFASEINRVGRHYWVQTPDVDFPVDPHYLLPFFQHLSPKWQKPIADKLSGSWMLGGYYVTRGWNIADYHFQTVLGLNGPGLLALFPNARLLRQRFLGLSQSIVAANVLVS